MSDSLCILLLTVFFKKVTPVQSPGVLISAVSMVTAQRSLLPKPSTHVFLFFFHKRGEKNHEVTFHFEHKELKKHHLFLFRVKSLTFTFKMLLQSFENEQSICAVCIRLMAVTAERNTIMRSRRVLER